MKIWKKSFRNIFFPGLLLTCEGVFFFVIIAGKTPYEGPVFQAERRVVANLWPKVPPDPVLYESAWEWSSAWAKVFIDRIDTPRKPAAMITN